MKGEIRPVTLEEGLSSLKKELPKVEWYMNIEQIMEAGVLFGEKPKSITGYTGASYIMVELKDGKWEATVVCENTHPYLVDRMEKTEQSHWPVQAVVEAVEQIKLDQLELRDRMQKYGEHFDGIF